MRYPPRFLYAFLMVALLLRVAMGAPCCLPGGSGHAQPHADQMAHAEPSVMPMAMLSHAPDHSDDHEESSDGHHEGDNTANPCCSACGPTLASAPPHFATNLAVPGKFADTPAHALSPRDLIRLYQATGPPLTV